MSSTRRSTQRKHDVVVGVDGTPASANAIRYAREEAARCGGVVEVVHVVPDVSPLGGFHPVPPDELMAAGRAALDASLEQAGPPRRGVRESAHVCRGHVVASVSEAARQGLAVVLGSDRRPVSMRLLTGNVSTGVSARSTVPVVSVPETWSADRDTGVVVVGVKHPEHCGALLTEAFEVARRRGGRLVVLHAWRLPIAYDDLRGGQSTLHDWAARAVRELEDAIAPWRSSHPDVDVELRCVHDQAAHALVLASESADELLLARRAHGLPAAVHLGSTARAVLLYAHCPVRVVPAVHVPVLLDLALEAAGAPLERTSS